MSSLDPIDVAEFLMSVELRIAVAVLAGIYLLWTLYQRLFVTDADPSITLSSRSDAGTTSMLLSGVYVTATAAVVIVAATWPLAMESVELLIALGLAVLVHYIVERREVDVT